MSYVICGAFFVLMFWLGTRKPKSGGPSVLGKLIGGKSSNGQDRPK